MDSNELFDAVEQGDLSGSVIYNAWRNKYDIPDDKGYTMLLDLQAAVAYAVEHVESARDSY